MLFFKYRQFQFPYPFTLDLSFTPREGSPPLTVPFGIASPELAPYDIFYDLFSAVRLQDNNPFRKVCYTLWIARHGKDYMGQIMSQLESATWNPPGLRFSGSLVKVANAEEATEMLRNYKKDVPNAVSDLCNAFQDWDSDLAAARALAASHRMEFETFNQPLRDAGTVLMRYLNGFVPWLPTDKYPEINGLQLEQQLIELADSTPLPPISPLSSSLASERGKQPQHKPASTHGFDGLNAWAETELKGIEQKIIQTLCNSGGEKTIVDLATIEGIEWNDESDGFKNACKRLKPKLKKIGWAISRKSNIAKLNRTRV